MSKTKVKAWHWLREDRRLQYGDRRVVEDGGELTVDLVPALRERGLHASERLVDALRYAPGPVLCRVEVGGQVIHGDDKLVGTARRVLWSLDDDMWLWRACVRIGEWALEQQLADGFEVQHDSFAALEARRAWLDGYEVDLSAAWSAAWAAARSAAESAAWSAARSAAWSAAESAAWSAARSAAESAARSAAWSAAESAAWSAAESAAWSVQEEILLDELEQVVGKEALR